MTEPLYGVARDPVDWCRMRAKAFRDLGKLHHVRSHEPKPGVFVAGLARSVDGLVFHDSGLRDWEDLAKSLPRQNLFVEIYLDNPAVLVVAREERWISGYCGLPHGWVLPRTWSEVTADISSLRDDLVNPWMAGPILLSSRLVPPWYPDWLLGAWTTNAWFRWDYTPDQGHAELPADPSGWLMPDARARQKSPYRYWGMAELVEHCRNQAIMLGTAALAVEELRRTYDAAVPS